MRLDYLWNEVGQAYTEFENTHSNSATINLICIYSLYKTMNGKRKIDISKISFPTHKAKTNFNQIFNSSVKVCKVYYKLLKRHKIFEKRKNLYPYDIYKYIVDCILMEFGDAVKIQNYSDLQNCKIEIHGLVSNAVVYSISSLDQAKYLYVLTCKKLYNTITSKDLEMGILYRCRDLVNEYFK